MIGISRRKTAQLSFNCEEAAENIISGRIRLNLIAGPHVASFIRFANGEEVTDQVAVFGSQP